MKLNCNERKHFMMKMILAAALIFPCASCVGNTVHAETAEETAENTEKEGSLSVVKSEHSVSIGGKQYRYTAETGGMEVLSGGEKCEIFYTSYTLNDSDPVNQRPVTFAFNGGPGCASIYLHMGMLGPRRMDLDETGNPKQLPTDLIDNEYSILDLTDLVFIDPVGTGYSHALEGSDETNFLGYKNDCRTVGDFIRQYVNRNNRWSSPKYLIGESYGTTRAAGVARYLDDTYSMSLNGIMMLSSANDFGSLNFETGNDLPYGLFLPSYAAVSWYHKKLNQKYLDMELVAFLDEVRTFAGGDYQAALFKGRRLTAREKETTAEKLAEYTGLSKDYILKKNLRITEDQYCTELFADENKTVGRIDGRFIGPSTGTELGDGSADPSDYETDAAFSSALNRYLTEELGYQTDIPYLVMNPDLEGKWTFQGENVKLAQEDILYKTISKNSHLKVWVMCGYYDLATPFFCAEWTYDHIFLNEENAHQLQFTYYPSGHMIYLNQESLAQFKEEAKVWYQN